VLHFSGLPSKGELRSVPIKYLAAFAGRCALRVRPLFAIDDQRTRHYKHKFPFEMIIDRAIQSASYFAGGKTFVPVDHVPNSTMKATYVYKPGKDCSRNAAARAVFTASSAFTRSHVFQG
jgi:hypothetical protein